MIFAPTVHIWTESERRKEKQTNNIQKEYFVINEKRIICIVSIGEGGGGAGGGGGLSWIIPAL